MGVCAGVDDCGGGGAGGGGKVVVVGDLAKRLATPAAVVSPLRHPLEGHRARETLVRLRVTKGGARAPVAETSGVVGKEAPPLRMPAPPRRGFPR